MSDPLTYSLKDFAAATGLSVGTVKNLIAKGELAKSYVLSKSVITRDEATRFIKSLPSERQSA